MFFGVGQSERSRIPKIHLFTGLYRRAAAMLANLDFARGHAAFTPLGHACEGRCCSLSRPRGPPPSFTLPPCATGVRNPPTLRAVRFGIFWFRGVVCIASREPAKGCPTHSDGGWLFGGCTAARGPRVPPSVCDPAPLSTARGARRRVGTTVSPIPSLRSLTFVRCRCRRARAREAGNHALPRVRARRHHRDWGQYGAVVGVSASVVWARSTTLLGNG